MCYNNKKIYIIERRVKELEVGNESGFRLPYIKYTQGEGHG